MTRQDKREREARYRQCVDALDVMVRSREKHAAEEPVCDTAPFCPGPGALMQLAAAAMDDPSFLADITLAAVGEMSRLRRELADTARRLDVQRGITADVTRVAEERETLATALGEQVRELEARCSWLQGELDAIDDVSDLIGPIVTRDDLG